MTQLNNRKIVSNSFNNGMDLDSNPMVISNDCLTSCLNGTLITHNGNEFILQNDMGNGRVESAALPTGYIPLGIKEHGGIVYVASKNVVTGDCLIGSFPSPERNIGANEIPGFGDLTVTKFEDFCSGDEIITDVITKRIYPNPLKPEDTFFVSIPVQDDSLTYRLGIKSTGGVERLNTQNFKDGQVLVDDGGYGIPSLTPDDSSKYWNYDGKSVGDLYLITSIEVPSDIDISIKVSPKKVFFIVESDKENCVAWECGNNDGGEIELLFDSEINKYSAQITYPIPDNEQYLTFKAVPIIKHNNEHYKVRRLKKEITVDILAELAGDVALSQWRYHYNEDDNILELTYGFTGASSVKEVFFSFYAYDLDSDLFIDDTNQGELTIKPKTILAESRRSYSGQFTDLISSELVKWQLYLCKIQCKKTVIDDNTGEERTEDCEPMYKIVWTNDLLNEYNTSLTSFDTATLDFQPYLEVSTSIQLNADKEGTLLSGSDNLTPSTQPAGGFTFDREYKDTISITPTCKIHMTNLKKLNAFGYIDDLYKEYIIDNNDSEITYTINPTLTNIKIDKQGQQNLLNEGIKIESATDEGITVTSTYCFLAGTQEVTQSLGKSGIISNFFDSSRNEYEISPDELLFGYDDGIHFGLGIGAGKNVSAKKDIFRTYYGFFDLTLATAQFEPKSGNLADNSSCKAADWKLIDRDWLNDMSPKITNWIKNELGFIPIISCIASCKKEGHTYGGKWVDNRKENKNKFRGYDDIDYALYTKDDHYKECRNYIIPMWLNYETDAPYYYILINSTTWLDSDMKGEKLYGADLEVKDEGKNYMDDGNASDVILKPASGSAIIKPIKDLFSNFYVLDPQNFEELTTSYFKADINNYTYNNSITATLEIEEIVKLNDESNSLKNEFAKINNRLKELHQITKIGDNTGILELYMYTPDSVITTYTQEIPKKNIAIYVNDFINPTREDTSNCVGFTIKDEDTIIKDGTDGRGHGLNGREIYYKSSSDSKFYPLSSPKEGDKFTLNNGVKVDVSLLKQLKAVEIKIDKKPYTQILIGNGSPTIGKDYGEKSYNSDYAQLPHIGCLVSQKNGSLKNGDLFPFSFIWGRNATGSYAENYKCCLALSIIDANNKIKTSKQ